MNRFGPTSPEPYPAEMRTQLWPLCCGLAIISGFKDVGNITEEALLKKINRVCDEFVPDHQVYKSEVIKPKTVLLTLNDQQMASKKIMDAISAAGFVKFAEGSPRGSKQGIFMRDKSESFKFVA